MSVIELKCPSCGANLNLDDSREMAFCEYCGEKIILAEKKTVSVEGAVAVEGIASSENLLIRARQFYNEGYIDKAEEYYNRILDLDPFNQEAKEGVALCIAERRSISPGQPNVVPPAQRMAAIQAIQNEGGNVRITRPKKYDAATTVKVTDTSTGRLLGKIRPKQTLVVQLDIGTHDLLIKYPTWKDIHAIVNVTSNTCVYDCMIVVDGWGGKGHVEITARDLALQPKFNIG